MSLVARRPRAARWAPTERDRAVQRAIVAAVAYADVFDWPLWPFEVHRFLSLRAGRAEVDEGLAVRALGEFVSATDGQLTLVGRESLVAQRRHREALSAALWPEARSWGRRVAGLPFVRMVAVTGSLAVNAAAADADIDLFVVTADGRLWLTRALTVAVVRTAATAGTSLCPNYLLASSALALPERDLFTAHELVQMVPLAGRAAWQELMARNNWVRDLLPNHPGPAAPPAGSGLSAASGRRPGLERALGLGLVDRIERWEMGRKIDRWDPGATGAAGSEARFGPTVCKGHDGAHRREALAAYQDRLRQLGLTAA